MAARVRIVILSIAFLLAIVGVAHAESIFVDRSSLAGWEDGSASAPFKTITQALELARKIRFGAPAEGIVASKKTINLHVAAGTYVGSFAPSADPLMETLPVLLNVPRLYLRGGLQFDKAGDIVPGTETILRAATRQGPRQHMLVVTRTNPTAGSGFPGSLEMAGDAVTITGFRFEGWAADGSRPDTTNASQSALISLDGVADFVVRENHITHAGTFGITARLSSGRIEGNLIAENRGVGLNLTAGSKRFPARLEVLDNRLSNNSNGGVGLLGAAQTENDRPDLFIAHTFRRVPLPQFFDRALHPEEVPDRLDAYLVGNEVSGSRFGIRAGGYIRDQYRLDPLDPGDETANLTAEFVGNVSRSNSDYGVVIDAGQISAADPREYVVNIDISFDSTTLESNGQGPALFGFWRYATSISAAAESDLSFKFAHDSTMRICGDITRFSYENRATDPTDQAPTNNALTVNNNALAGFCVPLYGCMLELPPTSPECN